MNEIVISTAISNLVIFFSGSLSAIVGTTPSRRLGTPVCRDLLRRKKSLLGYYVLSTTLKLDVDFLLVVMRTIIMRSHLKNEQVFNGIFQFDTAP